MDDQKSVRGKKQFLFFCEEAFIRLRNFGAIFELICSLVNVYLVPIQMDCLFENGERMNLFSFAAGQMRTDALHAITHSWCHISSKVDDAAKSCFVFLRKLKNKTIFNDASV